MRFSTQIIFLDGELLKSLARGSHAHMAIVYRHGQKTVITNTSAWMLEECFPLDIVCTGAGACALFSVWVLLFHRKQMCDLKTYAKHR